MTSAKIISIRLIIISSVNSLYVYDINSFKALTDNKLIDRSLDGCDFETQMLECGLILIANKLINNLYGVVV